MLGTEAAAVFDELTRKHITEGLNTWPDTFRNGQFVPAVEYLRAARVRTKLMRGDGRTDGGRRPLRRLGPGPGDHQPDRPPERCLPDGIPRPRRPPRPGSVTLTGRLYDESTLLAVARAFQQATGDHLRRPPLEVYLAEEQNGRNRKNPRRRTRPGDGLARMMPNVRAFSGVFPTCDQLRTTLCGWDTSAT